jgi:hypothetical protein
MRPMLKRPEPTMDKIKHSHEEIEQSLLRAKSASAATAEKPNAASVHGRSYPERSEFIFPVTTVPRAKTARKRPAVNSQQQQQQ